MHTAIDCSAANNTANAVNIIVIIIVIITLIIIVIIIIILEIIGSIILQKRSTASAILPKEDKANSSGMEMHKAHERNGGEEEKRNLDVKYNQIR